MSRKALNEEHDGMCEEQQMPKKNPLAWMGPEQIVLSATGRDTEAHPPPTPWSGKL